MSPDDQRPTRLLDVVVTDHQGRRLRKPGLVRWLQAVAPRSARGTLGLALVSDRVMRRMNREFARHDYVTDVLSFPAGEDVPSPATLGLSDFRTFGREPKAAKNRNGLSPHHLGDIVIATGRAARQAEEVGHTVDTELRVLALHGLLHVLGYDHARDAGEMARVESRLRRKGGLGGGLIERARREQ